MNYDDDDDDDDDFEVETPKKKMKTCGSSIFTLSSDDDDENMPSFSKILKESDLELPNQEADTVIADVDIHETESLMMTHALEISTCDMVERYDVHTIFQSITHNQR